MKLKGVLAESPVETTPKLLVPPYVEGRHHAEVVGDERALAEARRPVALRLHDDGRDVRHVVVGDLRMVRREKAHLVEEVPQVVGGVDIDRLVLAELQEDRLAVPDLF